MTDEPTRALEKPDARSAERLRLAVDAAGMGEWDWDIVTGEVVWSRQCRALYGLPPEGPVDYDRFLRTLHPEDRDRIDAALNRAVEECGVYDEEKRCIWPDGSVHWTASRAQVFCDETGRPTRMTGVTFDITERKNAEDERKRLEDAHRQAQKLEVIGRLAGGVVHDFNNLLTIIIVYSDLLRGQVADNAAAVADLEEIRHAVERARGVTRQLLALSRRGVPKMQVLDVNAVLRANERMLRLLVREDIEFEIRTANQVLPVRADPLQIEQVLLNLVVNARDATRRGGRIIVETSYLTITAASADVAANVPIGTYASLTVRDTGTGMTAEVAARAFEPFFTTKPSESGTGLGLSTVAETVKQLDGYVWAQSKPGHGSAFTILVPLTSEQQEAAAVQAQVPDRQALQGLKVALVEDEDPLRRFVADALRRHGVEVLEFANASEAMPALTTSHVCVDVLLTDVILPGMSGPELVQRVTAVLPDLKILYMSGYAPEEFGFAESFAGAPVLKKPFHADELFEHVLMCVG